MRRSIMFLVFTFIFFTSTSAQWTQANGPYGGRIYCLSTIENDSGQTVILAGTDGGIFTSTNNGLSWKNKSAGISDRVVRCITANGSKIFAGTDRELFVSVNNGETWEPVKSEYPPIKVTSILINGTNILTGSGFWGASLSTDGGTTWKNIDNSIKLIFNIRALAQIDTVIFAASPGDGVLRSTDGGNTWSLADSGLTNLSVITLLAAPNTSGGKTLLAGTYNGVFASTDTGGSWTAINHGMDSIIVRSIAADGTTLYAGSLNDGVFASTNNGANWKNSSNGLLNLSVWYLAKISGSLFAATEDGIYVSTDDGALWKPFNEGLHAHSILTMAFIEDDIFAGTQTGGAFLSADKGESWKPVNTGLKDRCILALAAMGDELIAGSQTSGFFKSTNHGLSWKEINNGYPKFDYYNSYIYLPVFAIALSGNNLVASVFLGSGISVSTDHGENWFFAKTDSMFEPLPRIFAVMGNTVFTANQHGEIHISNDNGLSWKRLNSVIPDAYINDMAVLDSTLFVASDYKTIRTTDCGSTWSDVKIVPGKRWQYSFAVYQNYIYAGTDEGEIYLSANNGTSWLKVASGTPAPITRLYINGGNFYAATYGNGVWKYPLQEIISSAKEPSVRIALKHFSLEQNYPNPFNPVTAISYSIPKESFVELKVFDMLGREVASLVNKEQSQGEYKVEFDASRLPSGIYIYSIQAGEFKGSKKLMVIK